MNWDDLKKIGTGKTCAGINLAEYWKERSEKPIIILASQCKNCWKKCERKLCGKCLNTRYCSKDCQVNDWPSHKLTCIEKKMS